MSVIKAVAAKVEKIIKDNNVVLFTASMTEDKFLSVKGILDRDKINYFVFPVDDDLQSDLIKEELTRKFINKRPILPIISIRGRYIGNYHDIIQLYHTEELFSIINDVEQEKYNYDLIIVGGGIGGITAAKEAESLNKRVGIFDYVKPTNKGTVWKEGGASLNVGVIPKKLMYHASLLYDFYTEGALFGWELKIDGKQHNWHKMFRNIQNHINNIRRDKLVALRKEQIDFYKSFVKFENKNTIQATDISGNVTSFTAMVFILATGSRQEIPDFPGSNFVITTDDLFMLQNRPGKTLILGAESITLELAGILNRFGIDCTIATKESTLMKNYDSEMVNTISNHLISIGVKIIKQCLIVEIVEVPVAPSKPTDRRTSVTSNSSNILEKRLQVSANRPLSSIPQARPVSANVAEIQQSVQAQTTQPPTVQKKTSQLSFFSASLPLETQYKVKMQIMVSREKHTEKDELFDVIVQATERIPSVTDIGLENLGVKINERSNKVLVDEFDRTTCSTIFAVGNIVENRPALTSVTEKSAKLLVQRMFGSGYKMDYKYIPAAVFTPLQYGYCGYTEQKARAIYGESSIEKFFSNFVPLEWAIRARNSVVCSVKLICLKNEDSRVIGLHILGPNASEIIQGFALSIKAKVTKNDFDRLVGIHPTCAEIFTKLKKV